MQFEEIILEKLKIGESKIIPKAMLMNTNVELVADDIVGNYVANVETWLATERKELDVEVAVSYPATWWEMLKEQYFPDSVKLHYPVKYITKKDKKHVDVYKIYPELDHDLSRPLYKIIYTREKY